MDAQRAPELMGRVGKGKSNSEKALRNFENKSGNPEGCGMLLRGAAKEGKKLLLCLDVTFFYAGWSLCPSC